MFLVELHENVIYGSLLGKMRDLTDQEKLQLEAGEKRFAAMMSERGPILVNFAQALDLPNPYEIMLDPESYIAGVDSFVQDQEISKEDWTWIVARIGYFIGEVLNERLNGRWFLNDLPDTPLFLRCVIGHFENAKENQARVDPFEAAVRFLKQPPKRYLSQFLEQLEHECRDGRGSA